MLIIIKLFLALITLTSIVSSCFASENIAIRIGDNVYSAILENNVTATEIFKHLPLTLELNRYAEHEYYSELPFKPEFARERTSHIKAGHLYYWDGWNAFVINYEDYDISPYKVVHIGTVNDASEIAEYLRGAGEKVNVTVQKGE